MKSSFGARGFGLLFIVPALAACANDEITKSDGGTITARAFGHVYDVRGLPAAGIQVRFAPQGLVLTTDDEGLFRATEVPAGPTRIAAQFGVPSERCLSLPIDSAIDLGDFFEGMASGCDLEARCQGDQDCDGLTDGVEEAGWRVSILRSDRTLEQREVVSDPAAYDTDRDGLSDAIERAAGLDPAQRDTDGDLLSDYAELVIFHSNGTMVDTDGDACPETVDPYAYCITDPNLWDGFEVLHSRTSPTLSDTDGDGKSDLSELRVGGTNPRLADLPELDLRLFGNPLIQVQVNYETGSSTHQQELDREEEEQVDTDSVSTKMSIENTVQLHTETEAGTGTWPPSFKAQLTTDTKFQHGYFHDTSSSWKSRSVQESQKNYESWERSLVSFDDGKLSVAMKIVNRSDLSFALEDLRVVAYRLEGGGGFTLIGTMQPDAAWATGTHILGPGGELTMTTSLEHIGAAMMRSLVRNPTAMTFEVGSYSLFQLDEFGNERTANYAKLGESVVERTGLVLVDFGDGRVERHMVATNVFRRPDGSGWGIKLGDALRDIGLDYETVVATSSLGVAGQRVLSRIEDVSAYDACRGKPVATSTAACSTVHPRGFWLVAGIGRDFKAGTAVDVDELVLESGDRIHLVYNDDQDGDGIFDREEYLLGTDKTLSDTDGDELSDYAESKVGWTVRVANQTPYTVYSDPRFEDIDGDFLSDRTEMFLGTDPYLRDTDGDGDNDTIDSDPLSPPCLSGASIGLTAWWDGSWSSVLGQYSATDIWVGEADQLASTGQLISADPRGMLNTIAGNAVFQMNQDVASRSELIQVPSDASISPQHELTASAWIYWQGIGAGSEWATILTKGPSTGATFELAISKSGDLRLGLLRNVHEKCWYCSFGSGSLCDDRACADEEYDQYIALTASGVIHPQGWMHVAASFGGEMMRLYVDGVEVQATPVVDTWWGGWFRYQRTTNHLVVNDRPLRIGLDEAAVAPYRGLIDDVQISLRSLTADQMLLAHSLGVCRPPP
ncbi:MAG: LamG-like jellyroll fold domain-containing protein [Myxococcota bacterium]